MSVAVAAAAPVQETVHFMSRDGATRLTGYLFRPAGRGPHPAIVMLHGRSGSYSSPSGGTYTAEALTMRHRMWGNFWAERGYLALHVDSFGPRGYPQGFPRHSYSDRPPEVNEQRVRPLDAYGALDYLRSRSDVIPDRVGVQGWSNGGMAVLSAMSQDSPGLARAAPQTGFRAALAFYPSCRVQERQGSYRPYAPLLVLAASNDDEVSPALCQRFAVAAQARGAPVDFVIYEGAQHSFDDPGKTKQSHGPNRLAIEDSKRRAEMFFVEHVRR
jgi:dienelactone hydrolase